MISLRQDVSVLVPILAQYLERTVPRYKLAEHRCGYGHMGATLTDAILQAGLRYETVVLPRVERVLSSYPHARLTSQFLGVLHEVGPKSLLRWSDEVKPQRLLSLVNFLADANVQSESDLHFWLESPCNTDRLKELPGIGPKTLDYLRLLAGHETFAVDRHIQRLVQEVCDASLSYAETHQVLVLACDRLGWSEAILDMTLWRILSQSRRGATLEYARS